MKRIILRASAAAGGILGMAITGHTLTEAALIAILFVLIAGDAS